MPVLELSSSADSQAYAAWLQNTPEGSLWQSREWRGYQGALGRETRLYGLKNGVGVLRATALVAIDRTAFGLSTWDIPRGPLFAEREAAQKLLQHILEEARRDRCMALYCSPPHTLPIIYPLQPTTSHRTEQPEATLIIDLTNSDDELLAQMQPKGRYNIRVAQRHGVWVEEGSDVDVFYELLQRTAARDGFRALPKRQYECFLKNLPGSFLLFAYPPSPHYSLLTTHYPIAGLLGVVWGKTGYYYYGASDYAHRALMAPYVLQWEAMRLCRARGCTEYDLLGITPPTHYSLLTTHSSHPWTGVTRFKIQFGGTVRTYPPEQEVVLRPFFKTVIEWKRRLIE